MGKFVFEHPKGECITCPMLNYNSGNGWGSPSWSCKLIKRENCAYPIAKEECPLTEEKIS